VIALILAIIMAGCLVLMAWYPFQMILFAVLRLACKLLLLVLWPFVWLEGAIRSPASHRPATAPVAGVSNGLLGFADHRLVRLQGDVDCCDCALLRFGVFRFRHANSPDSFARLIVAKRLFGLNYEFRRRSPFWPLFQATRTRR
jgi:hypothetical protein